MSVEFAKEVNHSATKQIRSAKIMRYLIGGIAVILGLIQLFYTRKAMANLQVRGNKNTSSFVVYAYWSGFIIGVILIIFGFAFAFQTM